MGMDERQPFEDIAAAGSPATPDALRSIVARHQRARTRTLGVALAVALVAGPVAGWAIGHSGGGGQEVATKAQPDAANGNGGPAAEAAAPAGGGVTGQAFAYPDKNPPKTTHLFNRTSSDGIAIRAYRIDPPPQPASTPTTTPSTKTQEAPCPAPPPGGPETGTATANANSGASASASASSGPSSGSSSGSSTGGGQAISSPPAPDGQPGTVISGTPPPCGPMPPPCATPSPTVHAEVSNDAAVGDGMGPIDDKAPADPLSHLSVGMFGVPENASAVIVTVQTGPGVATVRLRLPSGATDEMAPIGNIAVLAHASDAPPPTGVVEALDGSGKVLASQNLNEPGPKTAIACAFSGGTVRAKPMPAPVAPPTTR
jgi:hypothetical protein